MYTMKKETNTTSIEQLKDTTNLSERELFEQLPEMCFVGNFPCDNYKVSPEAIYTHYVEKIKHIENTRLLHLTSLSGLSGMGVALIGFTLDKKFSYSLFNFSIEISIPFILSVFLATYSLFVALHFWAYKQEHRKYYKMILLFERCALKCRWRQKNPFLKSPYAWEIALLIIIFVLWLMVTIIFASI